ncbi:hypothetical protein KK101_08735 [Curtobacterium flaccumfaciens pv. oortii]|uniref:hypothetical protein n=1 Tax=Curtobacterium flaccumfaciens TaxID=2035 RepID=UPI001BDDF2E5|nr:hypothetical protein [Curtobacterium flaccumfaciens]MBT1622768.1 hypothetical protein [Curtobacterium flaccumfaciens pv. oortii]
MHHSKLVLTLVGALVVTLTTGGAVVLTTPAEAAMTRIDPACSAVPQTTTESDGVPGPVFYKRLQCLASMASYTGPIDGVMGWNSWTGVSGQLAKGGYFRAAITHGWESPEIVAALQRWAAAHGRYSGPIDGVWGPNSYRGAAWALNRAF